MVAQDTTTNLPLAEEEDLSYLVTAPLAAGLLVRGIDWARGSWRIVEELREMRHGR